MKPFFSDFPGFPELVGTLKSRVLKMYRMFFGFNAVVTHVFM